MNRFFPADIRTGILSEPGFSGLLSEPGFSRLRDYADCCLDQDLADKVDYILD
jgi:hypothetical protein